MESGPELVKVEREHAFLSLPRNRQALESRRNNPRVVVEALIKDHESAGLHGILTKEELDASPGS